MHPMTIGQLVLLNGKPGVVVREQMVEALQAERVLVGNRKARRKAAALDRIAVRKRAVALRAEARKQGR